MCIRDRCYLELFVQATTVYREQLRPSAHPGRRSGQALRCNCLLYTSDAADERSSVDLGGRRIIKQKHKHDIVECHLITKQDT